MKKLSRLEVNKDIRRVLAKNQVDLAYCQYTCYGMEIKLTGWLCKNDTSDFSGSQIEAMLHDFKRFLNGYTVFGDFDNWNFSSDRISYLGDKEMSADDVNTNDEMVTYEINIDDQDSEAS